MYVFVTAENRFQSMHLAVLQNGENEIHSDKLTKSLRVSASGSLCDMSHRVMMFQARDRSQLLVPEKDYR